MEENVEEIIKLRRKITSRNPQAFQKKIDVSESSPMKISLENSPTEGIPDVRHVKGCN